MAAFRADLAAAQTAAQRMGIQPSSIVFPRNQLSAAHLDVCREFGLRAFRGNERVWFHQPRPDPRQSLLVRGFRLGDAYLPLAGAHDHEPAVVHGMVEVSASRFLRAMSIVDPLRLPRLRRITLAMEAAARRRTLFHLWWHPHNFGVNLSDNLSFLREVLDHFRALQEQYGMRSMNMAEVADEVFEAGEKRAQM